MRVDWDNPISDHPLNIGLVSRWQVGEDNPLWGGPKLFDLAGLNHGTLNGPTWSGPLGRQGGFGAIDFSSGVATQVVHDRPSALQGCSGFTVSSWIYIPSGLTGSNSFWGEWDDGGGNVQQFARYDGGMQWFIQKGDNSGSGNITIADGTIAKNTWSHFCFVADGSQLNAYLNGVSAATPTALTGPYIPSTSYLFWRIGRGRTDSSLSKQDDHCYWNRALSSGEVYAKYRYSQEQYDPTLNWIRPRKYFFVGGGGGGGAISATIAAAFANTGTLTGSGALAATSAAAIDVAGALTGRGALAATSSLVFDVSGTLTGSSAIASTVSLAFANTGSLTGAGSLAATSSLAFSNTGVLTGTGSLASNVPVDFAVDGVLVNDDEGAIIAAIPMAFAVTGTLTGSAAASATVPLAFTNTTAITGYRFGTAEISSSFTTAGAITGTGALLSTITMPVTVSGTMAGEGAIAAIAAMAFDVSGIFVLQATGEPLGCSFGGRFGTKATSRKLYTKATGRLQYQERDSHE